MEARQSQMADNEHLAANAGRYENGLQAALIVRRFHDLKTALPVGRLYILQWQLFQYGFGRIGFDRQPIGFATE